MSTIALTGADGGAGTLLRPLLRERHSLTLFTRTPIGVERGERNVVGTLADAEALDDALANADIVVHLAGVSTEGDFEPMIESNILGTHQLLEAASRTGVQRVIVASSGHVLGGTRIEDLHATPIHETNPSSFYGASKVAVEAIARVHAHKYALSVVIARIGTILERPQTKRQLSTWLSPRDFVRLVETTLALENSGSWTVWAVSNNSRSWLNLQPGRQLGYAPLEDSEPFAAAIMEDDNDTSLLWKTLGGPWYGPSEPPRGSSKPKKDSNED